MGWKANAKVIIWDEYIRAESAGQVVASTWGEFLRWAAGQSAQCSMPADAAAAAPAGDALAPIAAALGCAADSGAILDAIGKLRAASEPAASEPASASEQVTVKAVARTAKPAKAQKPAKPADIVATWRELARYASTDQTRPAITCVQALRLADSWCCTATDGHRLLRRVLPLSAIDCEYAQVLLPAATLLAADTAKLQDAAWLAALQPSALQVSNFPDAARILSCAHDKEGNLLADGWRTFGPELTQARKLAIKAAQDDAEKRADTAGWTFERRMAWEVVAKARFKEPYYGKMTSSADLVELVAHGDDKVLPIVSVQSWSTFADASEDDASRQSVTISPERKMYAYGNAGFRAVDEHYMRGKSICVSGKYLSAVPADFDLVRFTDMISPVVFRSSAKPGDFVIVMPIRQ